MGERAQKLEHVEDTWWVTTANPRTERNSGCLGAFFPFSGPVGSLVTRVTTPFLQALTLCHHITKCHSVTKNRVAESVRFPKMRGLGRKLR